MKEIKEAVNEVVSFFMAVFIALVFFKIIAPVFSFAVGDGLFMAGRAAKTAGVVATAAVRPFVEGFRE